MIRPPSPISHPPSAASQYAVRVPRHGSPDDRNDRAPRGAFRVQSDDPARQQLRSQRGGRVIEATAPTSHAKLLAWVEGIATLTRPDRVHWFDGSEAEYD